MKLISLIFILVASIMQHAGGYLNLGINSTATACAAVTHAEQLPLNAFSVQEPGKSFPKLLLFLSEIEHETETEENINNESAKGSFLFQANATYLLPHLLTSSMGFAEDNFSSGVSTPLFILFQVLLI